MSTRWLRGLSALLMLFLAPQQPPIHAELPGEATVRILFTNNSNGKLVNCNCRNDPYGGLAERVDFVRRYRAGHDNVLLLDSGGYLGLSSVNKTSATVLDLMTMMDYTAWGVGDQELYRGLDAFLELSGDRADRMVNASISRADDESVFQPFRIVESGGVTFGVIGIAGPVTFRFFPDRQRDFAVAEPDSTLAKYMSELMDRCEYIIVLSQLGYQQDQRLAARWPDIDLIIGGHSQTLLEKADTVGSCRIVQAGKNGGRIGEVIVTFSAAKEVGTVKYRLMPVTGDFSIPDDVRPLVE